MAVAIPMTEGDGGFSSVKQEVKNDARSSSDTSMMDGDGSAAGGLSSVKQENEMAKPLQDTPTLQYSPDHPMADHGSDVGDDEVEDSDRDCDPTLDLMA